MILFKNIHLPTAYTQEPERNSLTPGQHSASFWQVTTNALTASWFHLAQLHASTSSVGQSTGPFSPLLPSLPCRPLACPSLSLAYTTEISPASSLALLQLILHTSARVLFIFLFVCLFLILLKKITQVMHVHWFKKKLEHTTRKKEKKSPITPLPRGNLLVYDFPIFFLCTSLRCLNTF